MTINAAVVALNFSAAVGALVAASLWYRSATVKVSHKDEPDASGMYPGAIVVDEDTDFISTAAAQAKWSKYAAAAAAIAAALQGLALLLQSLAA